MRKTILGLLLCVFAVAAVMAQSPTSFNYQAVLRDDAGEPIASETVSVEIAILMGGAEVLLSFRDPLEGISYAGYTVPEGSVVFNNVTEGV